jgi:restriction system protein
VPPPRPGWLGRLFGGEARHEAELAQAWREHERRCAQHAAEEHARRDRLARRQHEYEQRLAREDEKARRHNAEVHQFAHDVEAREQRAVAQYVGMVLDSSVYPEGFPRQFRVLYQPDPRAVVVEHELPGGDVIPTDRQYRYVQSRDTIEASARPAPEVRALYASVIAQVALRALHEIFDIPVAGLVNAVTFNGQVFTKDPGTGQPTTLYVITLTVTRERFAQLVLTDLDPVTCVKQLGALMSNHPYDLEPVRPVVDFDRLLAQYDFVEGMDAAATLDSRPDLLEMSAAEFEHLVRQLFEAVGMEAWVTVESKDEGVDAVVTNPDPVFGAYSSCRPSATGARWAWRRSGHSPAPWRTSTRRRGHLMGRPWRAGVHRPPRPHRGVGVPPSSGVTNQRTTSSRTTSPSKSGSALTLSSCRSSGRPGLVSRPGPSRPGSRTGPRPG